MSSSNTVTVTHFGLQAGTERTIYAKWEWNRESTDSFGVIWQYWTSDGVRFEGADRYETIRESFYTPPANAVGVAFSVKPYSTTYMNNGVKTYYWIADRTSELRYHFAAKPPDTPPVPTVTVDGYQLTAKLTNINIDATEIQFQVASNDSTIYKTGTASIITNAASYSCTINVGSQYKVRCRAKKGETYSEWSNYSDNTYTQPSAPYRISKCVTLSPTSVQLEWSAAESATSYDIEYATTRDNLGVTNKSSMMRGVTSTTYTVTGLPSGNSIYFRVRAVNSKGESAWTGAVSTVIGTKPQPPTTWSSTTTTIVNETVTLYWVHNSEDNSKESDAQLELTINGNTSTVSLGSSSSSSENGSYYTLNTNTYQDGSTIRWRVRTKGVVDDWSDWSVERTIYVYAPPTLGFNIMDNKGEVAYTVTSFPFYIVGAPGPNTQTPIGYHVSIVSNDSYECRDEIGNVKMITKGSEIYSEFFDTNSNLLVEMTPVVIDLENNMSYTVTCIVTMDSGLNAEETFEFNVSWEDDLYSPNAEIAYDPETLCVHIRPHCESYSTLFYQVEFDPSTGNFYRTNNVLEEMTGNIINDCYTEEYEDAVYYGRTASGAGVYYCKISGVPVPTEGVTMSVYRREYDGRFIEIGSKLVNTDNTFVTDPHPALDYARYRVVAISDRTGAVSYNDIPAFMIGEKAVIIQWDETWKSFETAVETKMKDRPWAGSMLKLPYNIDVSDNSEVDVSLVKYIGRSHPVSYYGTQVGSTSTWNVEIPKSDKNTLYALRRLAVYMGDVYVREPSGSGYWANIAVSFSQTHCEKTIPVTLDIKRVEGGV